MQQAHVARLRRLRHRVRQLRQHQQPGEPRAVRRDLGGDPRGRAWSSSRRSSSCSTPRPARFWPIASSAGPAPSAAPDQYGDNCDKCGAHYSPTDLIDPVSTLSGRDARGPHGRRTCSSNIEQLHGFLERVDAERRALAAGGRQLPEGPLPATSRCATGTSRGRPPTSASRFPTSPGNYWYVWFDAPIGYMASTRQWCDRHGENFDDWWRSDQTRDPPLHRQGHHLLPHAVLARHAQDGRLQPADEGPHPRLPDRRRREDVQEQGHVRHAPRPT